MSVSQSRKEEENIFNDRKINLVISCRAIQYAICSVYATLHWVYVQSKVYVRSFFSSFLLGQSLQLFNIQCSCCHSIRYFYELMCVVKSNILESEQVHTNRQYYIWDLRKSSFYDCASVFVCWCVMQSKFVKMLNYFRGTKFIHIVWYHFEVSTKKNSILNH